jgi:deoxyribonuclease-4
MVKLSQLGYLEEVLTICGIDERLIPCIDFGHLHCRGQGALKSKEDFAELLDAIEDRLGMQRARSIHIHFSRIEYTASGEKSIIRSRYAVRPEFPPLAELLAERRYSPVVICESRGTMAEDALAMQKMYEMAAGRG